MRCTCMASCGALPTTWTRSRDSITCVAIKKGDSIADIIRRIGISGNEVGPNIFLNGRYSPQSRKVNNGDRLGIFPDDMPMIIV